MPQRSCYLTALCLAQRCPPKLLVRMCPAGRIPPVAALLWLGLLAPGSIPGPPDTASFSQQPHRGQLTDCRRCLPLPAAACRCLPLPASPLLQVVVKSQILAGGRGLGKFTNGLQVCAAQHSVAHGCASLSCSSTPPFVVLSTPHAARGTQQKQENNPASKTRLATHPAAVHLAAGRRAHLQC